MKNITISIDEETHRLACFRAEEMDTSVPELVRQYLTDFAAAKESERERRRRRMREVIAKIRSNGGGLRMEHNLTREELYDRVAARSAAEDAKRERRRRRLKEVTDDIAATRPGFSASDNLSREELYDRARARAEAEEAKRQHDRDA